MEGGTEWKLNDKWIWWGNVSFFFSRKALVSNTWEHWSLLSVFFEIFELFIKEKKYFVRIVILFLKAFSVGKTDRKFLPGFITVTVFFNKKITSSEHKGKVFWRKKNHLQIKEESSVQGIFVNLSCFHRCGGKAMRRKKSPDTRTGYKHLCLLEIYMYPPSQ